MTPFQEFRLWARRAPGGERAFTAVAGVLALALVVWILVPGSSSSSPASLASGGSTSSASPSSPSGSSITSGSSGTSVTSVAPGSSAAASTPGSGSSGQSAAADQSATSPDSSSGGSPSPGVTTGGRSCPTIPAGTPGVTAKQMKIAITLTNIEGGAANSLFGIPTPQDQQTYFQAAIDGINKDGGVACRTLVAQFFSGNPADQSNLQQVCLDIANAGVFAEVDSGSYANIPIEGCFAQHHVPYFGAYFISESYRSSFYPYLFDFNTLDSLYRNTVLALHDRGFFGTANGFKKLGFIYRDCYPGVISEFKGWLHQVGLTDAQIVTYDVGCPALFASSSDIQQAVLKFKTAGVTHVTDASFLGDFPSFTETAQQQNFHPKYGLADDAMISIAYGSMHPNYGNIANAIAIAESRDGEERTPGMSITAGTAKCNAALKAKTNSTVYRLPALAGNACDQLWMLTAAANNSPVLRRDLLADGLQRAKSIDFSFPQGPNDFTGSRITTGGELWRVAQFKPACTCWQVIDQTFHPSYP